MRVEGPSGGTAKPPEAANDNGLEVIEDWPDIVPVTENELQLLGTRFADIISELVAANDNNP